MLIEDVRQVEQRTSGRSLRTLVVVILAAVIIATLFVASNWPYTRQSVTQVLQARTARTVEMQSFRMTFFPPGCVAEGVKFLRHKHPDQRPVIFMQKLIVRGSYLGLLTRHIPVVQIVGMHVTVPPREPGPDGQPHSVVPLTYSKGPSVDIGTIISDAVILDFMSNKPGAQPYRLDVQKLELRKVGNNGPFDYTAMLFNSKPPGEIHSTGKFGPWNPDDPGRTPVSGSYTLDDSKLGVFAGISGSLSSKGTFQGALDRINVDGTSDIPAFHVEHSSHAIHLSTSFHAVVNGADGDVQIGDAKSSLQKTTVISQGEVAGKTGQKGKFVDLTMTVQGGRIEDLMRVFLASKQPPMTGAIGLRAQVEVPPGERPFLQKLKMNGDFGIGAGHFMNVNDQGAINHLSESARGEKKDQQKNDPQTVLSDLKGHVSVQNGVATLSNVSFSFPGALAHLHGVYNLLDEKVDLHGTLETDGKLSDTASGFKALMLKVVNPFFKKKAGSHGVKLIPFKITGTSAEPKVGLEF